MVSGHQCARELQAEHSQVSILSIREALVRLSYALLVLIKSESNDHRNHLPNIWQVQYIEQPEKKKIEAFLLEMENYLYYCSIVGAVEVRESKTVVNLLQPRIILSS